MERKTQRLSLVASSILLLVLVSVTFWHTSLKVEIRPADPVETVVLWGIFTLAVLGVFTLGFIVFRSLFKLWVERRKGTLGSKIKTKLVVGALALSLAPTACLVIFSFSMLSRTFDKWFTQPAEEMFRVSDELTELVNEVMVEKTAGAAMWVASLPEVHSALAGSELPLEVGDKLRSFASGSGADYIALLRPGDRQPWAEFGSPDIFPETVQWPAHAPELISRIREHFVYSVAPVRDAASQQGRVVVAWQVPRDLASFRSEMEGYFEQYALLHANQQRYRYLYSGLLTLLAVFVLFIATWLAMFLSKQIIVPIEALVQGTSELSSGHLGYRVQTKAVDELGALVESFNHMTQQLEGKTRQLEASNQELARANDELESRRRLINAILESITTGVISVSAEGKILKVNSALSRILPGDQVAAASGIDELFGKEEHDELRHMMKRALRTGVAEREFQIEHDGQIAHLAVTVSALESQRVNRGADPQGFVIVLEATTELLRAQKSAAWTEVARRVAHEIKNPLTPIALSAERMRRMIERSLPNTDPIEQRRLGERLRECIDTIAAEVLSLRKLVDEFSQFARFPRARPENADLNRVVMAALDVFEGRLDGITVRTELAEDLPPVYLDPEQFKRVLVNLIDNAAEAVQASWVKEIYISTGWASLADTAELTVADCGPGISAEDKERLFLPYFSTKKRGTGLGLAIVNRIVQEHQASIRVEDNRPSGSRFIIELPVAEVVTASAGVGA